MLFLCNLVTQHNLNKIVDKKYANSKQKSRYEKNSRKYIDLQLMLLHVILLFIDSNI